MHHHNEDQAIWIQMKQGNGLALVQLYDHYVDALYSYGKRFTAKTEIVEDAIQDLLTELWYKREKLIVPASIKAYLLKAFRQKLLRQLSQYKRLTFTDQYPRATHVDHENYLNGQVRSEQELALKAKLKKSLANLSPKEQEAIALKYAENLTHEEIAEIMDIKKQTLYNLLHSAVQKLSKALQDEQHSRYVYLFLIMALLFLSIATTF
ncbi:RNA polymerase sigma factor [Catalinimonas niigatensis]|uniref:RNA polymerase sigma factor n=1 Tax=Catalinimonas niigatensis TaxID=1397264 RepID=UPI0026651A5D|nr:sigma-70 family RNA polymerase sigma factor [Catalinimonas niigatensis]WPP51478.1 sigma-70 family RNA polymerase sigma factor [Catalinimonas niigatensis]